MQKIMTRGVALALGLGVAVVSAQSVTRDAETSDPEEATSVNRLSAERAVLYARVLEQEKKARNLWRNPAYTSPEIEKLRNALEEVEREAARLRMEIRAKVSELPEAKKVLDELKRDREALQSMTEQRDKRLEHR